MFHDETPETVDIESVSKAGPNLDTRELKLRTVPDSALKAPVGTVAGSCAVLRRMRTQRAASNPRMATLTIQRAAATTTPMRFVLLARFVATIISEPVKAAANAPTRQ